jgi:hypothetical protein
MVNLSEWFEILAAHTMHVILAAFVIAAIITLVKIQRAPDTFDLRAVIADDAGKPSVHKIGQLTALVLSTWQLVYLTIHNQMTVEYFGLYMGVWAAAQTADKWISKSRDRPADELNPPPSPPSQS